MLLQELLKMGFRETEAAQALMVTADLESAVTWLAARHHDDAQEPTPSAPHPESYTLHSEPCVLMLRSQRHDDAQGCLEDEFEMVEEASMDLPRLFMQRGGLACVSDMLQGYDVEVRECVSA